MAMACVFLITLILLHNIKLCLMILVTVVLTLVDVVGICYFMGVKIDTVSCVSIILIVGLCVDYSAHITHIFSVAEGSTSQGRMTATLVTIGPAILNGGTTTLVALFFMGFSTSYAFGIVFKVRIVVSLGGKQTSNNCRFFFCRSSHFQLSLVSSTVWYCYLFYS
jgi:Niemann-Pick C1 protein